MNLLKSGFGIQDTLRIQDSFGIVDRNFLESGFVTTIRYLTMDLINQSMFLRISYTIPTAFLISYQYRYGIG
jgi:hypothetical protein